MTKSPRRTLSIVILAFVSSCGGEDAQAPPPPPSQLTLRIVSGSSQTDSIDARLTTPLVAEVAYDDGRPAAGIAVRFAVVVTPPAPVALQLHSSVTSTPDSVIVVQTDASGRASVLVDFMSRIGTFTVTVSATGVSGASTATFAITPGRAHKLTLPSRDTLMYVGRSLGSFFSVTDRAGNTLTASLTSSVSACRIDAALIVGVSIGRCRISISATPLEDSLHVSIVPVASVLAIRNEYDPFKTPRLVSMGLDGTAYTELAPLTYQFPGELLMPLRAPDGRRITLHSGMGIYSTHLTIFDSSMTARTFGFQGFNSYQENWGRFSPDGQWIYLSARGSSGEAFSVWRARPDGTQPERITPIGLGSFLSNFGDLTPDGKTIVFVDGSLRLNVIDVTTRIVRPLTGPNGAPLQAFQLRVSPDGRRVAFIFPSPRFGLYVINIDGTGYRRMSADIGYDIGSVPLDWTADGEWILTRRHEFVGDETGGIIFPREWVLLNAQSGAFVPLPYKVFTPTSMMFDR